MILAERNQSTCDEGLLIQTFMVAIVGCGWWGCSPAIAVPMQLLAFSTGLFQLGGVQCCRSAVALDDRLLPGKCITS